MWEFRMSIVHFAYTYTCMNIGAYTDTYTNICYFCFNFPVFEAYSL